MNPNLPEVINTQSVDTSVLLEKIGSTMLYGMLGVFAVTLILFVTVKALGKVKSK